MKTKPASMLWELIGRLADTCLTFRISGEPGVGKEAIVQLIRRHYPNPNSKYVTIKCKEHTLPEGAAAADAKFQTALADPEIHVFFFQDIQCLPDKNQQQIVQLVTRNHSKTPPWVFASSTKPLERHRGEQLNSELFHALDTIHIAVPPLRAHPDRIPQILSWYLNAYSKNKSDTLPVLPDAQMMDQILTYSWPGNLRQLQQTAWYAFESSNWDAAVAGLSTGQNEKNHQKVDEIAAIYMMSLAKLYIQREKIIEGLMAASKAGDIGLLDLAIYNEAVSQITNHISTCDPETSLNK